MITLDDNMVRGLSQKMTGVIMNPTGKFRLIRTKNHYVGSAPEAKSIVDSLKMSHFAVKPSAESDDVFLDKLYTNLFKKAPKKLDFAGKAKWIIKQICKDSTVATEVEAFKEKYAPLLK